MRNALVIFTALLVSSAVIGCSSKTSLPTAPAAAATTPANPTASLPPAVPTAPHPNPVDNSPTGANWTLKIQSKCQTDVTEDQCVGANGFTAFSDGRYQVGPTPQGAVKNGTLTPEELTALTTALTPVLNMSALATESHETPAASDTNPVTGEDTVTLTKGTPAADTIIHSTATDLSYRTQSSDQAKALLTALKSIETKYYTLPFPDVCGDSVVTLQALFASMLTCTADKDCAYVDNALEVVDPSTRSYVTTDDCSLVKPLAVANASLISTNKDKLATNYGQVQEVCGNRIMRPDCTETAGFNISAPATCKQGVCQAAPASATFHYR